MLVRCPSCKGGKKLMGIGMIYKTCLVCNGTGEVKTQQVMRSLETPKPEPEPEPDESCCILTNERPTIVITEVKVEDKPRPKNQKGSTISGKKDK